MNDWFFIPGNTPSLKNSKRIVRMGKMTKLIPSKRHEEYEKETEVFYSMLTEKFKRHTSNHTKPLSIAFYFVRDSRRKFDYTNAIDTVQDLIVKNGWIEDDNCTEMKPVISGYHVDKENAGVYMLIIPDGQLEIPKPKFE